jgi:hypothetical protein
VDLPARNEGPHSWLWCLVYVEVDQGSPPPADAVARTQAAGWLWEQLVAGRVWVRRDRSGLSVEGPDPWLGDLVATEAERHLVVSSELDASVAPDDPRRLAKRARPSEERVRAISFYLWRQLGSGWARVADDDDVILFWDPRQGEFVPFSLALSNAYVALFGHRAR